MALDDADKKAIAEMIAGALKPEALTAALQPIVAQAVTAATKPITERLDRGDQAAKAAAEEAKKAAEAEAAKKAEEEAKKAAAGTKPGEPDPALATKLRELEAKVKAAEDARAAAEAKTKQEALDRTLRDALATAGVPADRLRHALAVINADGVITEHNGVPHWKGKVGDVDGLHALDAGIDAWVKGEGKIYLPAVPVKPSGSEAGQRMNTGGNNGGNVDLSKLGGNLRLNMIP